MAGSRPALPVLSDGRVTLRAIEVRDLPAIEAGIHDPDVVRWIGAPEPSARQAVVDNEERWTRGSPTFSICGIDGSCVGLVWMNLREADPTTGFVGYWLLPAARGSGRATSAVRLLADWVVGELGVENLLLTTSPDNERSQRVAQRSGFRRAGAGVDKFLDERRRGQVVFEFAGHLPPPRA
jgi:RimJ/RimL family protein N-acetyltransferase